MIKIQLKLQLLILFFICINNIDLLAQKLKRIDNVQIDGNKKQIIATDKLEISGILSSGEKVLIKHDHGSCELMIVYKNKVISTIIPENYSFASLFEYDFENDGDKELLLISEYENENKTYLSIYRYQKGIIKEIFSKDVMGYKTIIKADYIEKYLPSGMDQAWHFYKGEIYSLDLYSK